MDRQRRSRIWPSATSGTRCNAKTIAELQRLPKIHMGRTNPGTSSDTQQRILRKLFNVNVHSVAGYAGSAEAFIAVERGELEGGCMTWASLPPHWIADNKITPIMRVTIGNGARPAGERAERLRSARAGSRPEDSARAVRRRRGRQAVRGAGIGARRARGDPAQSLRSHGAGPGLCRRRCQAAPAGEPDARAPSDENPRRDLCDTGRHRRRGARDRERLDGPQRPSALGSKRRPLRLPEQRPEIVERRTARQRVEDREDLAALPLSITTPRSRRTSPRAAPATSAA